MTVTLEKTADFGGYATKNGIVCADGLTIAQNAFADQDGEEIPLVYNHIHDEAKNVLGHAILENREDGVYAHCFFNGSENAQHLKHAVENGDIVSLSIYANRLQKQGTIVKHGILREVSLVLAGANPGAKIDFVSIRHSDGDIETLETEAIITMGKDALAHSDTAVADAETNKETAKDPDAIWADMSPEAQALAIDMMEAAAAKALEGKDEDPDKKDSEKDSDAESNTDADPDANPAKDADAAPESTEQEAAPAADAPDAANSDAAPAADAPAATAQHSATNDDLKGSDMTDTLTHNVFDREAALAHGLTGSAMDGKYALSHADVDSIFATARKGGLLKEAVEGFKLQHNIENIEILFPDAKNVSDTPEWVKRRTEWVDRVLRGTKHVPFSRIRSLSADLTLDQARAKGYIKGALKKEEFFAVAKRVTTPQTIYKKQKLERDDVLDITDFDVVVWIKGEMRLMLDEEIARAILIGDGRSNADDDKIIETNIRPIATDHELFQTTVYVNLGNANSSPEEIVDALLLNRRYYKGSGNPDLFTTEITISQILNHKDTTGRRIYTSLQDLATTLRVASIIPVEVMEEQTDLVAIMVNLVDYTVGADKGGDVAMFDDFDIDYNAYKYLIETRCSGALTKPKSALVVRRSADNAVFVTPEEPTWDAATHSVTVKNTTGLVYKNQSNGAILSSGTPVTLADGQQLTVIAVPSSSAYYLEGNEADEFTFDYDEGLIDGPH